MPTPDPHALPPLARPADALKAAAIEELPISGARFQQADLSGAALPSLSVRGCAFVGCRFAAADLAKLDGAGLPVPILRLFRRASHGRLLWRLLL